MAKIGSAEAVYSSAPSKKEIKRKEAEEVVYTPLSKEEVGNQIQQDIAGKINHRFTPSFSQDNAPKIKSDIARTKVSDEVASDITRQVAETVPIFQKENFTPSGLKSAVAKDIKDNQENRLKRTLIPSVNYDSDEAELEAIRQKRTNAFVQKEKAQKNWNDWRNSEGTALQKGLDYIGGAEVNNLRQDLSNKENEYNLINEEYTLKKQEIAEKRIQQKYGVNGNEYIALLEQKKDNAQSDSGKKYYENEIKRTRNELYGKTNVFEHIGNIAKEGFLYYNKGVAATVDFLLGTPAKWLGFENNIFTQANKDSTRWLEEASAETYKGSQSFGDTRNLTGQFGTALIAAVPDLLLTILSGGTSKTKELGTAAIELANPTFWSTLKNEIIQTVKSPIFYTSFVRELGTNYEENLEGGANEAQATLAALFASAVTAKMEIGGFQSLGDELAETKGAWRKLYKWALSSIEEGLEEPAQTSATNLINKIVYDHDKKIVSTTDEDSVFNLKRAAKEFAIGTFVGAALGGGQLTFSGIVNAKSDSQYKQIGKAAIKNTNIQEIIDYAKSSTNDVVRSIARQVDAKTISDADAGRVYQYAVTSVNEQFDEVNTVEDLNKVISEYFMTSTVPKAVRNIASAKFAEKLAEMNVDPETYEGLTPETTAQSTPTTESEIESGVVPVEQSGEVLETPVESQQERETVFTEPTNQEIYRDPTDEENAEAMFGRRKSAKQRHIIDVAKKLDSNMKVVFVDKNSKSLNGKNGKYNRDTNTMYIAKDLETNDIKLVEAYVEVFKHEFVHRLELRKAYKSFKDYLFNKSVAFEKYAKARLYYIDRVDADLTREDAINALVDMYVENSKGDLNLTREQAEREAVADFVARTLFKDKSKDFLQAIEDKNIYDKENGTGFAQMETDLEFFEEMASTDRTLLQKIIDAIRDLINSVKGITNLEKDLQYIEERLTRVYESADNKKTATESGEVLYSSDKPFEKQVDDVLNGQHNPRFDLYVSETPDIYVKLGFSNTPLLMRNSKINEILNDHPEMSPTIIKQIPEAVQNPILILKSKTHPTESVVAITDVITEKGNMIIPVWVNQEGNYIDFNIDEEVLENTNFVASAYGRNLKGLLEYADKNNGFLYQTENIKKVSELLARNELQLPIPLKLSDSDIIISKDNKNVKQKQLDIILETNPAPNTYQTWVRSVDDIHTWEEVLQLDDEREGQFVWGDFSRKDAEQALKDGTITVYSSYPIENGVFVSTSYIQAQEYAGGESGKVYSKTIPLTEVAWINGDEGQYANVNESYSSDDLSALQRDLYDRHKNGELNDEEYLEETDELWGKANETFGAFETGENAKAPIATPTAVAEDKPTERFTRTIIETGKLTEEMLQGMEEKVLLGDFSYEVISDEKALEKANKAVNNGTAEDIWEETVNGSKITKNQMAIGERLLKDAMESGNTKRVLELSAELADIFTRAGQVVQAARLLKKMTGAGRLVSLQRTVKTLNSDLRKKYGEDFPPVKISPESAKRLAEAKTAGGIEYAYQEIMHEVAAQVPVTFMDKWNAWRYFAMLSNPKTHIRNLVGNGIFVPAVVIKDALAVGIETAIVKDSSKKTKSLIVKKEYYGFAIKDAKDKGVKNLLKGNKYNDKTAIREKQRIFKNEALEFLTNFNSNALEAEDMLFKNIHYIHALAGFLQARKVDLGNVSQEILDEARIYAVKEAKKATFNDESALANAIQRFGSKNLAFNMAVEGVLPFKRTPINIIKRGIEYSPIGLIKTATKGLYDVKKGKISLTECIDGFASGLTGTGLLALGMVLSSLGAITGGEDDDDKSQFEKWLGKQEYAVEIGGKSYTVDWAAPANIPFFIGVEIANIGRNEEDFTFANIFNTMWNALEPITNLSMLSGIQSVIESARYAEPSQVISSIAVDALTSYGMQVVPSLSGAVARTIDPTQRSWYTDKNDKWLDSTAQTVKNNIQSKVPGLSYTQIPKIDMWGREVSRGGTAERVLENFVSPGYYSEIEVTETSEELKRIFNETDQDVFPNIAAKSFKVGNETKHLTAQEYVTYAKAKGSYSYEYIKEFMEAAAYKKLTDAEKADVITNLYKYANAKAKTTVSNYDLMKQFKTVTNWERNGSSAVDYYIYRAISK